MGLRGVVEFFDKCCLLVVLYSVVVEPEPIEADLVDMMALRSGLAIGRIHPGQAIMPVQDPHNGTVKNFRGIRCSSVRALIASSHGSRSAAGVGIVPNGRDKGKLDEATRHGQMIAQPDMVSPRE